MVKATGTETEYFELDKVKRKKAETWKLPLESQERRDGSQKATYAKLMKKGVTVFITDAPKGETMGKYPLVIFLHDASCAGQEDTYTLRQGLGAVVWATPEEQAKHPCFVVAPQFDEVVVDDNYNKTASAETTADLVKALIAKYPIDTTRVYITGQSMGCMMTYLLMSTHPSLFTAGYLLAGHWCASDLAPMSKKPLWLVSSAGASKIGAENAIAEWQQHGGVAYTAEWPLTATDAERNAATAELLAKGGNIHYSHLTSGSHFDTWRVAYSFEAVRDWLFKQKK